MEMLKHSLQRALKSTFEKWLASLFVGGLGFICSIPIYWKWMGPQAAWDEAMIWLGSFGGALISIALLFLWNLACAPYCIEKERANRLARRNQRLAEAIKNKDREIANLKAIRPYFDVEISQVAWGGEPLQPTNESVITLFITVVNVGTMPSIARRWRMWVIKPDGSRLDPELRHLKSLSIVPPGGVAVEYNESDTIYERSNHPITQGATAAGHLIGMLPASQFSAKDIGSRVFVSCCDALGNSYEAWSDMKGEVLQAYSPGMRLKGDF